MSIFLQGHSTASAIDLEKVHSIPPAIVYGKDWKASATGEGVLALTYAKTIEKGSIKVLLKNHCNEKATDR